jgi:hypothetical protein
MLVNKLMPSLLELPGVGPIVAGILLTETGNPQRFASTDHFASYCGAAPVERGSGQRWKSSPELGSPYCGYGPFVDRWGPLQSVLREMQTSRQKQALGAPSAQNLYRSQIISEDAPKPIY